MKIDIKYNVGKIKYLVSFHDGIKKHNDGSDFYDVRGFRSKVKMEKFITNLNIGEREKGANI